MSNSDPGRIPSHGSETSDWFTEQWTHQTFHTIRYYPQTDKGVHILGHKLTEIIDLTTWTCSHQQIREFKHHREFRALTPCDIHHQTDKGAEILGYAPTNRLETSQPVQKDHTTHKKSTDFKLCNIYPQIDQKPQTLENNPPGRLKNSQLETPIKSRETHILGHIPTNAQRT